MLDREVASALAAALGADVAAAESVAGGDVNAAARVTLADGRACFVKHHPAPTPGTFAAEARGLAWLAEAGALRTPRVLAHGARWLALEWLPPCAPGRTHAEALGRGLAALHAAGAPTFGLDHDNVLATLPQDNRALPDWPAFWLERRLRPTAARAIAVGRAPARWHAALDRLAAALPALAGPPEPPARLHGDLWAGNVLATDDGPALIDPAVYGGHREVDLAMLALFGGLPGALVAAYQEEHPLAPGWRERLPLWQLYPLMVHAALFGGGYAAQVDATLARLVGAGAG